MIRGADAQKSTLADVWGMSKRGQKWRPGDRVGNTLPGRM